MKISKKIFLAAITAAAVAFVGCGAGGMGDSDIIKVSGSKGTIDYTNDTENDMIRGVKRFNFEHTQSICRVTVDNVSAAGTSVIGYVFDEQKNDGLSDMYIAGLHVKDNLVEYYVSFFEDITDEELTANGDSFGKEYGVDLTTGKWVEESKSVNTTSDYAPLSKANTDRLVKENKLDCYVAVLYNEAEAAFNVGIYEAVEGLDAIKDIENIDAAEKALLASAKVAGGVIPAFDNTTVKGKVGCYANVKKGYTLTGSWQKTASKAAEVVEE